MELHTLGVDGGYSQQDVIEVARALTGWTIARGAQGGGFAFRGEVHDASAKTILGKSFAANKGIEEGEAVLVERDGEKLTFKQKTPPATTGVAP